MRLRVVAEGDADNTGLGMLHNPHRGERLSGGAVLRRRQHFDRRAVGLKLRVVKLVRDFETRRNVLHHRVPGLVHVHLELAKLVVTARAAANEHTVVLRPVRPVVPQAGMNQHQTLARVGKVEDRLAQRRVIHLLIAALVKHVHVLERARDVGGAVGVIG